MTSAASPHISCAGRQIGQMSFRRVTELGESVPGREFSSMIRWLLLALREYGSRAGDKIAIIGRNSNYWLRADPATLVSGRPHVMVPPSVSDPLCAGDLEEG